MLRQRKQVVESDGAVGVHVAGVPASGLVVLLGENQQVVEVDDAVAGEIAGEREAVVIGQRRRVCPTPRSRGPSSATSFSSISPSPLKSAEGLKRALWL